MCEKLCSVLTLTSPNHRYRALFIGEAVEAEGGLMNLPKVIQTWI